MIQCRENLGTEFFAALDNRIGQERFLPEPDEDTLAELEGLRVYVQQTLQAQDSVMKGTLRVCLESQWQLATQESSSAT